MRACLDVQILSPKRNLDHRSFFSLGRYANEFIQVIYFCERSFWQIDGFGEKRHGSADLHTPINPLNKR